MKHLLLEQYSEQPLEPKSITVFEANSDVRLHF